MKTIYKILFFFFFVTCLISCGEKEFDKADLVLKPISVDEIQGELQGDDYVLTWPDLGNIKMQITVYTNGIKGGDMIIEGNSYTHTGVDTNVEYGFVFKLTDGKNFSSGVVKNFMRKGASQIKGLYMSQIDKDNGYDAMVEWNATVDAVTINLYASNGTRIINETLDASMTQYLIEDVQDGESWEVKLVAVNDDGNSLTSNITLKIGKTAIGFLSVYKDEDDLITKGDDDEASAWLWLRKEYPTAKYLYFGNIVSKEDLEQYRVLFWLRDVETGNENDVWNIPAVANNAVEPIKEWYKEGGNLLLWSHAVTFITNLGRIDADMLKNNDKSIGVSTGGWNPDTWMMAVQLHPGSKFKKDFSNHPIYKGLDVIETERTKLIAFKGPGWTEDHNCLFFNIPNVLTGLGNQEENCYNMLTREFGIYPLGIWDSQIDWISQLNVWEAQQGNTNYKGTVLCIGNGGCEFSLRNQDGTPDISDYPKNNPYQGNVLKLAKNSLEYLKTR